jgi:hypothetical protein
MHRRGSEAAACSSLTPVGKCLFGLSMLQGAKSAIFPYFAITLSRLRPNEAEIGPPFYFRHRPTAAGDEWRLCGISPAIAQTAG